MDAAIQAPPIQAPAKTRPLEYLPVGFFGSTMGLTGLSLAWKLAGSTFGTPAWIAVAIGDVAIIAFVALLVAYGVKLVFAPDRVLQEFRHPIAGNLFGTAMISLLLIPMLIAPWNLAVARVLWIAGAIGMVLLAWLMVSRWMSDRQQVAHATPAWIVPVVGLLDVPLAIPSLGLAPLPEVMLFSLAVGLFFAVPLFTLIFSRLVFEERMPDALQPTLLILSAPFSVGFSSYVATIGRIDLFAEALYLLTLFVLSVLLGRLRLLRRGCPFRVTWWAVSFPLAAAAIAALKFVGAESNLFTQAMAWVLLALASVTIAGLLVRTLVGIARGELATMSAP